MPQENKEQGFRAKSDIYQGEVEPSYRRGEVYDRKNIKNFASVEHLFEKVGEVAIVSGDDSVKLQALNTKNSELETSNKDLTAKVEKLEKSAEQSDDLNEDLITKVDDLEKDKKKSLKEIQALVKKVKQLSPNFFDTAGDFFKDIFKKTEDSNS